MATKMTREEAIKIVQSATVWTDEERDALAMLIPELAESEDERIRKELKEAFEAYDIESTWNGIPIRSIFAWLEKQKEQNLIMANSPQLKEQKQEKFPPYVTGFKGDPDPAGVWKPSEEQMNALYDILHPADTVNRLALKSLYEQLKAL